MLTFKRALSLSTLISPKWLFGALCSSTLCLTSVNIAAQTSETSPSALTSEQANKAQSVSSAANAENWVYYAVESGDNLTSLFKRAGLNATDVANITNSPDVKGVFNRMMPKQSLAFLIQDGKLQKLKYIISPFKSVLISREEQFSYLVETIERQPEINHRYVTGDIENSFFLDAASAGLTNTMTMNFTKVFAWDVDFSQDLKKGDSFKVVYEQKLLDGERFADGNIVAAQFTVGGQELTGIFFRDSEGGVGFYTPEGRSMRKAFLRMPVEFARISSRFNPNRRHPILNKIRAHKGVDYAAKTGTPIMASGAGKIIYRGRKGDFGNTIIIRHANNITSLYAHMNGFNSKYALGSRVQQGDVIGFVGSTGAVTGPHLHYEFQEDGVHKDPLSIKMPKTTALNEKEMPAFKKIAAAALKEFQQQEGEQLAKAEL